MANVAPLQPGDPHLLGGYRLSGRIGQGGQGTVYLARSPAGEPVAIKLLRAGWARDPVARARLAREVAAARTVAPFCTARILAADLDGDEPFVVSEFIDGPTLQDLVAGYGPLARPALDRLAVCTANALSAIHHAGVIHRDFKPANVLMGPDGVRVIDFGIARAAGMTATLTSQVLGTPGYIAPEVVRGEPAGPAADVFAWAAAITYAATGTPPFDAPTVAAVIHQVTQGEPDLGALGGHLRGVVADCLAKDPAARPTALELVMRLLRHPGGGRRVPHPAARRTLRWAEAAGSRRATGGAAGRGGVLAPLRRRAPAPQRIPARAPALVPAQACWPAPARGRWPVPARGRWPVPARGGWPADPAARPDPGGSAAPHQRRAPGRGPGGPAPGRRRAGGWTAVIVSAAAVCVLGRLLVPALPAWRSLAGTGGPAARAPANAIPGAFAGTWSGAADQAHGAVPWWRATLVLQEGATGGTFTIQTIPCYATVTVTEVTSTRLVLNETARPDPAGRCALSGTISLGLDGAGRATMSWQDSADSGNTATGTFMRW